MHCVSCKPYNVLILYLQYEKPDEWRLSKVKRSARSVSLVFMLAIYWYLINCHRVKHLVEGRTHSVRPSVLYSVAIYTTIVFSIPIPKLR